MWWYPYPRFILVAHSSSFSFWFVYLAIISYHPRETYSLTYSLLKANKNTLNPKPSPPSLFFSSLSLTSQNKQPISFSFFSSFFLLPFLSYFWGGAVQLNSKSTPLLSHTLTHPHSHPLSRSRDLSPLPQKRKQKKGVGAGEGGA